MLNQSTTNVSCKDSRIGASCLKPLVGATSSKPLAPALAKLAAASLIIASAGFGAYYAGSLGAEQGTLLSIAMASLISAPSQHVISGPRSVKLRGSFRFSI